MAEARSQDSFLVHDRTSGLGDGGVCEVGEVWLEDAAGAADAEEGRGDSRKLKCRPRDDLAGLGHKAYVAGVGARELGWTWNRGEPDNSSRPRGLLRAISTFWRMASDITIAGLELNGISTEELGELHKGDWSPRQPLPVALLPITYRPTSAARCWRPHRNVRVDTIKGYRDIEEKSRPSSFGSHFEEEAFGDSAKALSSNDKLRPS